METRCSNGPTPDVSGRKLTLYDVLCGDTAQQQAVLGKGYRTLYREKNIQIMF